jgi:hypothetical protein
MLTLKAEVDTHALRRLIEGTDPKIVRGPLRKMFTYIGRSVQAEVRRRAPKRKGTLKSRVRYFVDKAAFPRWPKAVLVIPTAPHSHLMEYGTGTQGAPGVNHVPWHFPSAEGIVRWSGLPLDEAEAMARAIGRVGGVKPKPFVAPAQAAWAPRLEGFVDKAADDIEKKLGG